MKLDYSTDPGNIQTIEELWLSIEKLAAHIVKDNNLCKSFHNNEYSLSARKLQLTSLKALIYAIEAVHNNQ